jgi:basic membrane protein A and related proteins
MARLSGRGAQWKEYPLRRVMKLAAVMTAAALMVAGCGSDDEGGSSTTDGDGKQIKVGLAYDIGGRGDQSFNDAAAAGLDKAKAELKADAQELEAAPNEPDSAKEERLNLLVTGGYNPIIAVGFAYAGPLKKVATANPDVKFAIVDDSSFSLPNVANLVFAEHEGSFLVGAAAALKSKAKKVGFIGGVNTPLIKKFEVGYAAGVKAVDPSITIDSKYLTQPPDFTGFTDPAKGKVSATGMYDNGADVVYHAAGGAGAGVFEAAKAAGAGKLAIGVDSDQYNSPSLANVKDVILTSMLKRVDVAVFDYLKSVNDDSPLSGVQTFDLKKDGVGYSTSGGQVDDIKTKLEDYKAKIISGEIKVPDK